MSRTLPKESKFSERSNHSIQSIVLKTTDKGEVSGLERLHDAIIPSSASLQTLSVSHPGNVCKFIAGIADQCPALVDLSSTGDLGIYYCPDPVEFPFSPSWQPKLRRFIWNTSEASLTCDDALLDRLREATDVTISTLGIKSSFVVKLLSSTPTLVNLRVPMMEYDEVEGMESISFNLPHLEVLRLEQIPPSTEDANGSFFFKNFKAPNLRELYLEYVNPKDFPLLNSNSSPVFFEVENLLVETEEAATELAISMKNWKHLKSLSLNFVNSTIPSSFWNQFVRMLCPLSREAVESGCKDEFLLPKLESLTLSSHPNEVDSPHSFLLSALAAMIAARLAVYRRLSYKHVLLSAQGDLDSSLSDPSGEEVPFSSLEVSLLTSLIVETPYKAEEKAISWIKANVQSVQGLS